MKKAFDQTVRDIRREVNKKVLKVPGIEQKVLDATSNEPWGPHGSLLADIAQATRNYHEYQMIMTVIWKRINDTGKNWRHVYKALTVLEYLVAYGSERVIDEIREHAYQISTLSDFQYIDSGGRDQGSNVRKKSQSLVVLINDKERIQEARQKAAANREKFRNTSMGGMYRPGSYSGTGGYGDRYDDERYEGRYGSREDDRNGYGREKEWGYRDDDRYGGNGDPYSRDGDRFGRDSEGRYGRDSYRDDDYRGRSRSTDYNQYSSRSRSVDREKDRAYEDDGQYSSRGSGARADDHSQDASFSDRQLDRKYSEQNISAPPSYEEAVGEAGSPANIDRDGETSAAPAPKPPAPVSTSPSQANYAPGTTVAPASTSPPAASPPPAVAAASPPPAAASVSKEVDGFDEFDPRGSFSAVPTTSNGGSEMDLLGALTIMPVTSAAATVSEANASADFGSGPTFAATPSATSVTNQPFEDPFGDGPFRALPSTDGVPAQPQNIAPASSIHPSTNQSSELPQSVAQQVDTVNFGDSFLGLTYTPSSNPDAQFPSTNGQFSVQEFPTSNPDTDILADILPPSEPSPSVDPQTGFSSQAGHPAPQASSPPQAGQNATHPAYYAQTGQPAPQSNSPAQAGQHVAYPGYYAQTGQPQPDSGFSAPSQTTQNSGFVAQTGQPAPSAGFPVQPGALTGFPGRITSKSQTGFAAASAQPAQPSANFYGNYLQEQGPQSLAAPHMASQLTGGPTTQYNTSSFPPQTSPAAPVASPMAPQTPGGPAVQHNNDFLGNFLPQSQPAITVSSQPAPPPSTGSLAMVPQQAKDKFEPKSTVWADTLSRGLVNLNISGPKTNPLADIGVDFDAINRKEKRMEKPTTATVTSTITMGKAMGSGSGIGRAGAGALRPASNPMVSPGMGMGMGGPSGAGMGMGGYGGMNRPMGMGMGMNMGMGQGAQIQPTGFPPGSNMPGGYNPMMGRGGYPPQQPPYGGGYPPQQPYGGGGYR